MFAEHHPQPTRGRRILAGSLVLHAVLLIWLLYPSEPMLLNPVFYRIGRNGTSTSHLYWTTPATDKSKFSSAPTATENYRRQRLGQNKIAFTPSPPPAKLQPRRLTPAKEQDNSPTQTLAKRGNGAPAGTPSGSLNGVIAYGPDIRPALPVTTSDPVVYPWQLPKSEGRVVIEITINERGEITNKIVLESLGPDIDNKCLAALDGWRFRPATKFGAPIRSKQDAVFPFHSTSM